MSARILVIDDEASIRELLRIVLEGEGYEVHEAGTAAAASDLLSQGSFDLVVCDIALPDGSGLDLLRTYGGTSHFAMITAHSTPVNLLTSLRDGAVEYLSKPFDVDQLKLIVSKRLPPGSGPPERKSFGDLASRSRAMQSVLDRIPQVARSEATVLLTGESGTGKELLARTIHAESPRGGGPFVAVNCGALPEGLLESELFGHVRGSFTGATRDKRGLFEEAHRGTVFLDEVADLPLPLQVKLLRAIQDRTVRPVGGNREVAFDARVMAATNADLKSLTGEGRFREDLYFRLNVIDIVVPPLRQRLEDIPLLAVAFTERSCRRLGVPGKQLHRDVFTVLEAYHWPGNVRELENVIEQAVAMEASSLITIGSLPQSILLGTGKATSQSAGLLFPPDGLDLEAHLDGIRRELMRQALERCGGVQKDAARMLHLTYRAFRYHAEKLNLIQED